MNGPTGPAHRPLASRGIFPACGHAGLTDGDEGFEEFGDGGCVGPAELARDVGTVHNPAHTFQFFPVMAKLACPDRADAGSPPLTQ